MLLVVVLSHLLVLAASNPFHKYPFVFLLDIGNEELEKTNTEQIRVSVPGGSVAIRYPAVGEGEPIAHVRVSGIDFGTDLKANIVGGGPGYKYVVLVFMGNQGAPYDAVVTIQTLPNSSNIEETESVNVSSNDYIKEEDNINVYNNEISEDDPNDSAEVVDDNAETQVNSKMNAELLQSSSSVYNYVQNNVNNNEQDSDDEQDIHSQNSVSIEQNYSNEVDEGKDYIVGNDDSEDNNVDKLPKAEKFSLNNGYVTDDSENEGETVAVDSNLYSKYEALKPHLFDNVKVYEQEMSYDEEKEIYKEEYSEDPAEIDQMFNDEEIHNDSGKYMDTNNNYFDSDDSSAVAY